MVADYFKRLKKFADVEDQVLRPGAKIDLTAKVTQQQDKGSFIVAMDERGKEYTSRQFSNQLTQWIETAPSSITFVIGGAEGLPSEIKSIAKSTFALSKMTLPHRFARLLLMEQLYRAFCIQKNIPYHK